MEITNLKLTFHFSFFEQGYLDHYLIITHRQQHCQTYLWFDHNKY